MYVPTYISLFAIIPNLYVFFVFWCIGKYFLKNTLKRSIKIRISLSLKKTAKSVV